MKLENGRLQVSFAEAGELQTQRFDHTAVITQVVLDGMHSFCTPEQVRPGRRSTNGIGLCGEFVLNGAAEQAKAGEWFCKPGVGLLRQTEDHLPFDMWKTYEIRPFAVTVQSIDGEVIFRQNAIPGGGYGVDIEKAFRLENNSLILDIRVRNVGTQTCCLQEYQHNFVSLAGTPVSEGYVLELGCDGSLREIEHKTLRQGDETVLPSAVRAGEDKVFWERDMDGRILYHRSETVMQKPPFGWRLYHSRQKTSVAEKTDFCPSRIDVWAVEHCVCAELYHTVQLKPGETAHWQRVWMFEA